MFNFNLMNRALKDAELKDAFRMLYYIVNKCSLKNSMSVEIFDAEFELALSISPRSTCRFTKKLEERGYIKKEVRGTSQNKLANIYTLINIDTTDAQKFPLTDRGNKSDAQKFPLKNNNKINKKNNIFLSNNINIPDTDIDNINVDNTDDKNVPLTDDANIDGSSDGSSDGRIGNLKNNIKINKKNIHVNIHDNINTGDNIPEVINKNKFINNNINVDNTDEVFLSNFIKVDNINVDNSNTGSENLRIEIKNINNSNEMNNIINSNETDINTSTKSLKDILTEQSDEFNSIIQYMNNSVENTDEVNTSNKSMNISVIDTDEVNTSNNYKNISVEEQKRYQRLFNKCKSQIEIWMKTHEYSCVSMFDAYFEAIQDMKDNNLISVKQWNAAQRYLVQRFNNLRKGYNNYIQNKNKSISSNEISECYSPQPPRQQNGQMEEVV